MYKLNNRQYKHSSITLQVGVLNPKQQCQTDLLLPKTEGVGIAEEHYLLNFPFSIYKKHDGF